MSYKPLEIVAIEPQAFVYCYQNIVFQKKIKKIVVYVYLPCRTNYTNDLGPIPTVFVVSFFEHFVISRKNKMSAAK